MRRIYLIQILLMTVICPMLHAEILNVPGDFQTIQSAINQAQAGDTVLVRPGVYRERLVVRRPIVLASFILTTGDPAYIDSTIIDGDSVDCCISLENGSDTTLVRGFTICNGAQEFGGGIDCRERTRPRLEDLLITRNWGRQMGGGTFAASGSSPSFYRVRVVQNFQGGGCVFNSSQTIVMDQVTIADNQGNWWGIYTYTYLGRMTIHNSILYGHEIGQISIQGFGDRTSVNIAYCDIENGRNGVSIPANILVWGDGNIADDPQFVDPANGNYYLHSYSPCVDTGDPDGDPDPDGSRADMGALPFKPLFNVFIGGQVLDSATDLPLMTAAVRGQCETLNLFITEVTNNLGCWGGRYEPASFDTSGVVRFYISAAGYLSDSTEFEMVTGDSLWIETRLDHGELLPEPEDISVEVDSGGAIQMPLVLRNNGNGLLTWQVKTRAFGDAGYEPGELRRRIFVGNITGDRQIYGAVFTGESFYCVGANGVDVNQIYHISMDDTLLETFPQPDQSDFGLGDLDWDGEWIWAGGEDLIFALDRNGGVVRSWQGPYRPTNRLAYDPNEEILWLSGQTTDILAYDREGNNLGRRLARQGLRISGLACDAADPDSLNLYIVSVPNDSLPTQIYKMHTRSGERRLVSSIPLENIERFNGAFICRNYDRYKNAVLMSVADVPRQFANDQLCIWQLQPNLEWLTVTPDQGGVLPGQAEQLEIAIRTTAEDGGWSFDPGWFGGELVFTHDGLGLETIIPIHLRIQAPDFVSGIAASLPAQFGFTSIYPNPFNSTTRITFNLPRAGHIWLSIYDLRGRRLVELINDELQPGLQRVDLNLSDLPSGIYLARLEAGSEVRTSKLLMCK